MPSFLFLLSSSPLPQRTEKWYCLYPNPYPKSKLYKRRFYGDPSFALYRDEGVLGGGLEVRTNWETMVGQVKDCWTGWGGKVVVEEVDGEEGVTHFEEKYRKEGIKCWKITCTSL